MGGGGWTCPREPEYLQDSCGHLGQVRPLTATCIHSCSKAQIPVSWESLSPSQSPRLSPGPAFIVHCGVLGRERQRGLTVSQTRRNKSIPVCPHGHKLEPRRSNLTNNQDSSETFRWLPPSLLPRKCPNTKTLSGEFNGFKVLTIHSPGT